VSSSPSSAGRNQTESSGGGLNIDLKERLFEILSSVSGFDVKGWLKSIGRAGGPGAWINQNLVSFIISFVATITFGITGWIRDLGDGVASTFEDAATAALDPFAMSGEFLLGLISDFTGVLDALQQEFGLFGWLMAILVVGGVVFLTIRLIRAAIVGAVDLDPTGIGSGIVSLFDGGT
jgi:hypothetical protein